MPPSPRPHSRPRPRPRTVMEEGGREGSSSSSSMWAQLHDHLLELVLRCLPLRDRLCFGSVCRSWHQVQREATPPPVVAQLPWFLADVDRSMDNLRSITYNFYIPWEKEERRNHIGVVSPWRNGSYEAASHGWLFMDSIRPRRFFFLNPLSGATIPLPPGTLFCGDYMALSAPPDDPDSVIVLEDDGRLTSCRIHDKEQGWKWKCHGNQKFRDVVFYDGSFYAFLADNGSLAVLDLPTIEKTPRYLELSLNYLYCSPMHGVYYHRLVESLGEILMVAVLFGDFDRANSIQVWRADLTAMMWVRVWNLGDRVLFLTKGDSISVSASEAGVEGNRIVLANWNHKYLSHFSPDGETWQWMEYRLSDGQKEFHIHQSSLNSSPISRYLVHQPLLWMLPTLP